MQRNKNIIALIVALVMFTLPSFAEDVVVDVTEEKIDENLVEHQHVEETYQNEQKSIFDILFGGVDDKKNDPLQGVNQEEVQKFEEMPKDGDFRSYAKIRVLDKTLGKVYNYKIKVGNHIQFNELVVRALSCWSPNYPTLLPEAKSLIEIYDASLSAKKRLFYGWMFSNSSGAASFEHPKFDVQIAACESVAPVAEVKETTEDVESKKEDVVPAKKLNKKKK